MIVPMLALLAGMLLPPAQAAQTFTTDADGFIRHWLVLAPITFEGESGAIEIQRPFIKDEAAVRPRAGDKAVIDFVARTWTPHETADYFIDFYESFGQNGGEYAAGYAVTYVIADEPMRVTLGVGSNDQAKAWLNGKEVFAFLDAGSLARDTHQHDVTLVKGLNVLVLKVVNEVNNWQACVRFLRDGSPVRNLKISLTPE